MRCPECGKPARLRAVYCPYCGFNFAAAARSTLDSRATSGHAPTRPTDAAATGWAWTLLAIAGALLAFSGLGWLGVLGLQQGWRDRERVVQAAVEEHYDKGVAYAAAGQYELAVAELEAALRIVPGRSDAQELLVEAQSRLRAEPTPTPMLQDETKFAYYEALHAAYERADWDNTVLWADRLMAMDPSYRAEDVHRLAATSLYYAGLKLVEQERLEEALRMFDRALALSPHSSEIAEARQLASLYVTGTNYFGADWGKATRIMAELYELAPDYRDVRAKLVEARTAYGDRLAAGQDWCGAEQQYAQALSLVYEAPLSVKWREAQARCAPKSNG